jgi:hypothetical protein
VFRDYDTTFGIEFDASKPGLDGAWCLTAESSHAAVALALGGMPVGLILGRQVNGGGYLIGMDPRFLEAQDVGTVVGQPSPQTISNGGTDPVDVP